MFYGILALFPHRYICPPIGARLFTLNHLCACERRKNKNQAAQVPFPFQMNNGDLIICCISNVRQAPQAGPPPIEVCNEIGRELAPLTF